MRVRVQVVVEADDAEDDMLRLHRHELEALANALLAHEMLDRGEVLQVAGLSQTGQPGASVAAPSNGQVHPVAR
jgi:ATP-dependent Zn protease